MIGRIFTIGILFALTRRANREAKMEEVRGQTGLTARGTRQRSERTAQTQNLQRMRATSNAQLQMSLADSGVHPMFTGGTGGVNAAHIQRAAVNNAAGRLSGSRHGY